MKEDSKKKKWPKRLVIALIAVMLFGAGSFYAYVSDYYHAGDTALRLTQEMKTAGVLEESDQAIKIGNRKRRRDCDLSRCQKVGQLALCVTVPTLAKLKLSKLRLLLRYCENAIQLSIFWHRCSRFTDEQCS